MYISKFELKNIRGVGPEGLTVDLAKPAIKGRGRLAGWTVIAGPNGYGKTTLLQGIAASLMGPAGGRTLIGPDDTRWLAQGADSGTTGSWVMRVNKDDEASPEDETTRPVRLAVEWPRGGGNPRNLPPRSNHNFIVRRFWGSSDATERPDGWLFIGYGPYRAVRRSANDTHDLLTSPVVRMAACVNLFRDSAAFEPSQGWFKNLEMKKLRQESAGTTVQNGVLRLLSDRLLGPAHTTRMHVDESGSLTLVAPSGKALPVAALGDGFRMLIGVVLDILYWIDVFKPGRLEKEMARWSDPTTRPVIEMSGVVVIDEPENHLHPALQQHIGFWLKEHFPNIQFIVCTHSALICQAADKGGLFRMPGPFQVEAVDEDTWEAVTNGTLDDAIMTELFGLSTPVAPEGQKLRKELGDLEIEMQRKKATPEMVARRERLLAQLPDSIDVEVAAALRRLEARR